MAHTYHNQVMRAKAVARRDAKLTKRWHRYEVEEILAEVYKRVEEGVQLQLPCMVEVQAKKILDGVAGRV